MGLQHTETINGKWKVYKDDASGPSVPFTTYKGTSYMGSPAMCVPSESDRQLLEPLKQVTNPKHGDKFTVQDCMFGDVFTVKTYRKIEPNPDGSISFSKYREQPEGPPNAFMGMSERGVGTSLEKDPERGWVAVGYWYCPHVPPSIDPHESESKRMGQDTKELVDRWSKTDLMDGLDPNSQEAITTAALLENQRLMRECADQGEKQVS